MPTAIADLVSRALTATRARPTPPSSGSTPTTPASSAPDAPEWLRGFRTFDDPKLVALRDGALRYHAALLEGRSPHWLSLLGTTGTGKTHLARALWAEIRRRLPWNTNACAYAPEFVYWPDAVDRLRSGDWYAWFNDLKRWPYLVLDDIGAERDPSGFAADRLSCLLGCRSGRWTILTGNLRLADVEAIDVRIASRLFRDGSQVIECSAIDYGRRPRS